MEKNRNIDSMFKVPENYFETLSSRLSAIPAANTVSNPAGKAVGPAVGKAAGKSEKHSLVPYFALAAAFMTIVAVGTLILRITVPDEQVSVYDAMQLADLVPDGAMYYDIYDNIGIYDNVGQDNTMTEDELLQYLLSTGATVEELSEKQ